MDRRSCSRAVTVATPWIVGGLHALVAVDWLAERAFGRLVAGLVVSVGMGLALRWRHERPEAVAAAVLPMAFAYHVLVPEAAIPLAGMVAVFALSRHATPRRSVPGLLALLGVCAVNAALLTVADALFTMAVSLCVWALGEAARQRELAIRQASMRAVRDEQARIARELHDVIAHSVTVMVVQAGAAGDVFDRRPGDVRRALATIEDVGRETLGELRRLLGGVRTDDAADVVAAPQPGLARVGELAEPLRGAGLDVEIVEIVEDGRPDVVPAGVDVSAYRIVQEALTNTLRHAEASAAYLTIRYARDAIELDVVDDGRALAPRRGGGYGLVGMRERAALLGGTLDAGPSPHGGFRVRARLPLTAPA